MLKKQVIHAINCYCRVFRVLDTNCIVFYVYILYRLELCGIEDEGNNNGDSHSNQENHTWKDLKELMESKKDEQERIFALFKEEIATVESLRHHHMIEQNDDTPINDSRSAFSRSDDQSFDKCCHSTPYGIILQNNK